MELLKSKLFHCSHSWMKKIYFVMIFYKMQLEDIILLVMLNIIMWQQFWRKKWEQTDYSSDASLYNYNDYYGLFYIKEKQYWTWWLFILFFCSIRCCNCFELNSFNLFHLSPVVSNIFSGGLLFKLRPESHILGVF